PDLVTFWRSAAKPFQALPLLEDGAAARFGLATEELALACASHSSEPVHLEVTDRFLAKIGCTEADLACGPHTPLGPTVAERVQREGITVTPRWSNCSGKHSGMLALAKHHGWPTKGYEAKQHPVQQRILEVVERWTGCSVDQARESREARETSRPLGPLAPLAPHAPSVPLAPLAPLAPHAPLHLGIDGCVAVCFGLPLTGMARAYAALGDGATPELATLRDAMLARPDLVAGTGRSCTDVMRAAPGKALVKLGADGVYCGALPGTGLGFALKVEDGDMRTLAVALVHVLDQLARHLGWSERWSALTPQHGAYEIRNTRKGVTGQVYAEGELAFE
ncbi:MAG TPA: asparaginase, partial [Gemmatimonadales bacterium]|nr:asparaginase [Gemmatimonadales bacterium]